MGLTGKKTLASVSRPYPLPRTKRPAVVKSITVEEINQYWRMKRMVEEDHLLAAHKAVAKIRAKSLKEEDYRKFEETLDEEAKGEGKTQANHSDEMETWIRFRDWWTKSKYSYLNQPATKSMEENATPKRPTSTYIPQYTCFAINSSSHHSGFRPKIAGGRQAGTVMHALVRHCNSTQVSPVRDQP